jgi:hypothetical protein
VESIIATGAAAVVTGYLVELLKLALPDIDAAWIVLFSVVAGIGSALLVGVASGQPWEAAAVATRILEGIAAAATAAGLTRTMQRADVARFDAQHRPDA